MSVRIHASVLWRGAVSLGMRSLLERSAAMLGQVAYLIHEVRTTEQERSLVRSLYGSYLGQTPAVKLRMVVK